MHRAYINHWILEQTYAVDVGRTVEDASGWMAAKYTTDGLHPDYAGKRMIGEAVGKFVEERATRNPDDRRLLADVFE